MALKTLRPKVAMLAPRLKRYTPGDENERSRYRDDTQAWRRLYKTARWQKLRMSVLARDLFTCQMCRKMSTDTSKLVGDHIEPHHGDEVLFWNEQNIQCICQTCHETTKKKMERNYRFR